VLLMPVAARVKPRVAVAPTFVQPVAASVPEPGWVAGLFVGS
jgi:hypothetical protein